MERSDRYETVGEYLAGLDPDKRSALERLRKTIAAIVPRSEECISYGLPAICHEDRVLVWFGASARHCAFYPGARPISVHAGDLKSYDTSKGTIRFQPDKPLPVSLIRKLIRTRIAEQRTARKPKSRTAR